MSDLQRQARKEPVSQDQGQLVLVLPDDGGDPDNADMVPGSLMWQYMTPQEQWNLFTQNDR